MAKRQDPGGSRSSSGIESDLMEFDVRDVLGSMIGFPSLSVERFCDPGNPSAILTRFEGLESTPESVLKEDTRVEASDAGVLPFDELLLESG